MIYTGGTQKAVCTELKGKNDWNIYFGQRLNKYSRYY